MAVEIRAPRRDEMVAFYRCLPAANGLPSWEPAEAAWHGGPEPWPPMGAPATIEQLEAWADEDLADATYHPVGAFEDGTCVGASATLSFEVTVPGGHGLPMAGVTGTGVIATHRRRGHLRRMMQRMFDEARGRGEPLAMLSASEGGIYGRFGFSPATRRVRWEVDRRDVAFRAAPKDDGALQLVDAAEATAVWPGVHDAIRRTRVGELTPLPGHWDSLSDTADATNGPMRFLVHRDAVGTVDGIAHFRLPWSRTAATVGTLVVEALEATTPQAYRALWQLLLDFDLTRTVVAAGRPRDEPLRLMLLNPRALRITRESDNLWARILDVPLALASRSHGADDSLVIEVTDDEMCPGNVGRWHLRSEGDAASCRSTTSSPDLAVDIAALAATYLGGASVSDLTYAGRVVELTADAAVRLQALVSTDPEPHNSFGF